jgi:hypothetical protein
MAPAISCKLSAVATELLGGNASDGRRIPTREGSRLSASTQMPGVPIERPVCRVDYAGIVLNSVVDAKILYRHNSRRCACRGRAFGARRSHGPVRLAARTGPTPKQILAVLVLGNLG